ncbi:MAG TPA: hypothetical protein PKJ47_09575 [Candidatus Limiplasma sp.]|nr:hypothetical protein [Candidatus Limiplasma sp.]
MTTQELSKEIGDIKPAVAQIKERVSAYGTRLDAVEVEQKEQRRLLVAVERLAGATETIKENVQDLNEKLDKFGCRVDEIEQKPGKRWDTLISQIIGLIVAAGFGYLLSIIVK